MFLLWTAPIGSPRLIIVRFFDDCYSYVDWTQKWTNIVEMCTWELPRVLNQPGVPLLNLVGAEVNAGYSAIDAAASQEAKEAAYDTAVANLKTAVKREVDAYVEQLLGGRATVNFSLWCSTISARYSRYQSAWTNWTLDAIGTNDAGSVKSCITDIVTHLDYVYGASEDGNTFFTPHGEAE